MAASHACVYAICVCVRQPFIASSHYPHGVVSFGRLCLGPPFRLSIGLHTAAHKATNKLVNFITISWECNKFTLARHSVQLAWLVKIAKHNLCMYVLHICMACIFRLCRHSGDTIQLLIYLPLSMAAYGTHSFATCIYGTSLWLTWCAYEESWLLITDAIVAGHFIYHPIHCIGKCCCGHSWYA